jgi:hypothetical protein
MGLDQQLVTTLGGRWARVVRGVQLASLHSEARQHQTLSAASTDEDKRMEQDRNGEGPSRVWPWLALLVVTGLLALVVVMWQSETVRLIWADVWELVRSSDR